MNFTLPGTLLILKHLHLNQLTRRGLSACSLGPRGQRWGPRRLQPSLPGDSRVAPAGSAVGLLCSSWESPA